MQIVVSPSNFDDWASLLDLLQTAFAYMESRIDPPSSLHRMGITELRAKAHKETLIIAAEGTRLMGCAFVAVRDDCAYVGKLAVAEDARGQGVARQIMAAVESIARRSGRHVVELETRIELVENHEAFAALGFTKVAETAHPGYTRPTSITMRKHLPSVAREHFEDETMKKSDASQDPSASELISQKIAELGDWRGKTLGRMRKLIKEADPNVVEEWKWGTPVWSHDGILCTGETYKKVVKLTFAKGASLKDPTGLFNSSLEGNVRRAIDIQEKEDVDASAFKALVREAIALNTSTKSKAAKKAKS